MPNIHALEAMHAKLERAVGEKLRSLGFLTASATYHDVFPDRMKRRLSGVYTPSSLYLRGRADRVAVHAHLPLAIELEIKTHDRYAIRDLCLEALPFLHHRLKSQLGVLCLYVFEVHRQKPPQGFWCHECPPVRDVWIPPRWTGRLGEFFRRVLPAHFPEARLMEKRVSGTGDPFIVIDGKELEKLPPWENLVVEKMESAES